MPGDALTQRIKDILAREWGIAAETIPDDAALGTFEKWDSLGHIAVALALSQELGFDLDADAVQSLRSVPRIVEFVAGLSTPRKESQHEHCSV